MNPATEAPALRLAGGGNNYPMLGTGNSGYTAARLLDAQVRWVKSIQFQPYVNSQMSKFEALNDTCFSSVSA